MSVENAKAFIKRVYSDQVFFLQLLGQKTDEERKKFAADAGYDFTPDDVQQLLPAGVTIQNLIDFQGTTELPDEMMEAVAGGGKGEKAWKVYDTGSSAALDAVSSSAV
jgi:predicted ribosomally synthesized peptide with nif11-like leader